MAIDPTPVEVRVSPPASAGHVICDAGCIGPSPVSTQPVVVVNDSASPAVVSDDSTSKRLSLGLGLVIFLLAVVVVATAFTRRGRR
jgi:hypothetical protein